MGKFTAFKLPLKTMTAGVHEYTYHLDKQFFTNMESADIHGADIDVALRVTHKDDAYDLEFHITGTLTLLCDRCLDTMTHEVDTTYAITVKYGDSYCDDSDTVLEIPQSDNYLNVAYMLYDTVALTIPIKHVHAPGQCNKAMSAMLHRHRVVGRPADGDDDSADIDLPEDIGPADVADEGSLPTDPRWDALKGLGSDQDE